MCLIACAHNVHPDYPLIVLANRDEFYSRPSRPMHRWSSNDLLAGQDLQQGGTWLAINRQGDFAAVTNVRQGFAGAADHLRSRGELPLRALNAKHSFAQRLQHLQQDAQSYGGFNLLISHNRQLHYLSNRATNQTNLTNGIHLLSNAGLNTPWPKTEHLRKNLTSALAAPQPDSDALLALLMDDTQAEDHRLPSTDIPLPWERRLSSIFIRAPEVNYGTRASTLIILQRQGLLTITERCFDQSDVIGTEQFSFSLSDYP